MARSPRRRFFRSVARFGRVRRQLDLVAPARRVLRVQVPERLGDLHRIDDLVAAGSALRGIARVPGELMVPSITTLATWTPMLGIFLGQHLRQRAHHAHAGSRATARSSACGRAASWNCSRTRMSRALLAHRRQHFLGDEERPADGDVDARCRASGPGCARAIPCPAAVRGLPGSRRCRPAPRDRRPRGGSWRTRTRSTPARQVQFDDHAVAALLADRCRERRGIGFGARRQDGEETLLREFLRDRAADAPVHADRQHAVSTSCRAASLVIAAVRLPLRRRADDDGDRFAFGVSGSWRNVPFVSVVGRPSPTRRTAPRP